MKTLDGLYPSYNELMERVIRKLGPRKVVGLIDLIQGRAAPFVLDEIHWLEDDGFYQVASKGLGYTWNLDPDAGTTPVRDLRFDIRPSSGRILMTVGKDVATQVFRGDGVKPASCEFQEYPEQESWSS